MTVEFFKNKNKALEHLDEYGYNPRNAFLIKVRWNRELDRSGGRPMDFKREKNMTGTIGYITGVKRKGYSYTAKDAKKDGFDVISEHRYPKNRKPIFHKGVRIKNIMERTEGKVIGHSHMMGQIKIQTGGGRIKHISALGSRVIGCPVGEKLRNGRCVKK